MYQLKSQRSLLARLSEHINFIKVKKKIYKKLTINCQTCNYKIKNCKDKFKNTTDLFKHASLN